MARVPQILVVGSFVMDMITCTNCVPAEGETVFGYDFRMAPGGKGANQAVQAARLGSHVTMVGKVGDDMFGHWLLDSSVQAGVNVQEVKLDRDVPSAVGNVIIDHHEQVVQNRIIVVPGANMAIGLADVAFLEKEISAFDMVILQLEIPLEINILVARYAKSKGVPVMLNAAPSDKLPRELLENITYLSPNEHEFEDLTGVSVLNRDGLLAEEQMQAASTKLQEMGIPNILITLGSRGAAFCGRDEFMICPAREQVKVKDPTAAGDSFVAAFCTAVCCGASHRLAVEFANQVAAITVSRIGSQTSLPTIAEVVQSWIDVEKDKFKLIYSQLQKEKTA